MQLAKSSRKTIQEFFIFYLKDENFKLPEIEFFSGKFTHHLTRALNIQGITIGEKVFIKPQLLFVNSQQNNAFPDDLIVHEIMHVLQYKKEGFWTFLYKYVNEYRQNLRKRGKYNAVARSYAYFEISYEKEARDAAAKFLKWKKIKAESINCRLLVKKFSNFV